MKRLFILLFGVFLFLGCSSRESFEPSKNELIKTQIIKTKSEHRIIYFTNKTATLDNYEVLPSHKRLPKNFVAIDENLSKNGSILRVGNKDIKFNSLIVTAKQSSNLIAILFGDNHFELYDLNLHKTIASENFGQFLALRKFIAQPYFYKQLLLIPTLDGKMVIFDLKTDKVIRSVVVSEKDYFNNIIYLGVKGNNLIVASRDNVMIIAPNLLVNKKYNIKHILVDKKNIYVFTNEGKIIKLNFMLKELKEKNFKFANIIFPMFYNNKIYFLTRGDNSYLIELGKNLNNYSITHLEIVVTDDCQNYNLYLKQAVFGVDGRYFIGDYILKLK